MAAALTDSHKPPFDNLIVRVPTELRKQRLGLQQEGQKAVLNPTYVELPSLLSRALHCDPEMLGACVGLKSHRVSYIISTADGEKEKQIHNLLLAWVELCGEEATVEALLRRLYDAEHTTTIEEVVEWLNTG